MKNHFYHELVPSYVKGLTNLSSLIVKAEKHARQNKFDVKNILNSRLAPDMHTFITQVQYACFTVLESVGTFTERKTPTLPYNEKNVKDLQKTIKKTLEYIRKVKPEHFDGAEEKAIETFLVPGVEMKAHTYVHLAALPNFYFHIATAYGILRHNGVLIGKDDYIGKLPTRPKKRKK